MYCILHKVNYLNNGFIIELTNTIFSINIIWNDRKNNNVDGQQYNIPKNFESIEKLGKKNHVDPIRTIFYYRIFPKFDKNLFNFIVKWLCSIWLICIFLYAVSLKSFDFGVDPCCIWHLSEKSCQTNWESTLRHKLKLQAFRDKFAIYKYCIFY